MSKAVYLQWEGRSYGLDDLRNDMASIILRLRLDEDTKVMYTLVDVGVVITTKPIDTNTEWYEARHGVFTPISDTERVDFICSEVAQNPLVTEDNVKSMIGECFLNGWM